MKLHVTPAAVCAGAVSGAILFAAAVMLDKSIPVSLIIAVLGGASVCILPEARRMGKEKNRIKSYDMDIPDLMLHAAMFTKAGLSIWNAIERAVSAGDCSRPLYRDLSDAFERVRKGSAKDIMSAFEALAEERGAASLSDFCAMVVQNVRKGSSELSLLFSSQAQLYRNERRRKAGKLADEAASLLVIPSTIVLAALIIMLIAPAAMEIFGALQH